MHTSGRHSTFWNVCIRFSYSMFKIGEGHRHWWNIIIFRRAPQGKVEGSGDREGQEMDPPPPNCGLSNCLFRNVVSVLWMCGGSVSCFGSACNSEHLEGWNTKTIWKKKAVIANGWCEVEHHLDVCRATGGAHVEFVECKTFLESLWQRREFTFSLPFSTY